MKTWFLVLAIVFPTSIFHPLASAQPYVASEIPVSNRPEVMTLSTNLTFPFKPAEWPVGAGLLAGAYKAEREDEKGVFYRGENRAVIVRGLEGKTSVKRYALMVGGVWMPKDTKSKPRIYFYVEKTYPSVENLEEFSEPPAAPPDTAAAKELGVITGSSQATVVSPILGTNPNLTGAPLGRAIFGASIGMALVDAILLASITGNEGKINYWWMPIEDKEFLNGVSQSHIQAVAGNSWP